MSFNWSTHLVIMDIKVLGKILIVIMCYRYFLPTVGISHTPATDPSPTGVMGYTFSTFHTP